RRHVADQYDSRVLSTILFFFFSSRRRHTRWPRDWSSDVCSSDLASPGPRGLGPGLAYRSRTTRRRRCACSSECSGWSQPCAPVRSEERRVGKECRSRGSADEQKKKKDI